MFQLMTPEQLEALAKKKRDLQLQQQPPSTSAPNFSDGDNSIPDDDATILGNDERQKNSEGIKIIFIDFYSHILIILQ